MAGKWSGVIEMTSHVLHDLSDHGGLDDAHCEEKIVGPCVRDCLRALEMKKMSVDHFYFLEGFIAAGYRYKGVISGVEKVIIKQMCYKY